jgi:hypothetical protein
MDVFGVVAITPADLLPGEKLIRTVGTNVLLPLYPGTGGENAKPYVIGASASQKVLGMLHLTNYRLKFKPADGRGPSFSIFLPAIADASNVSWFFVRKFRVTMTDGSFIEFIMWGIRPFIAILKKTRTEAAKLNWDTIIADLSVDESKVGDWQVSPA